MALQQIIHSFVTSTQFETVAALIILDVIFGVAAAVKDKGQSFALTYLANFARNDVLGKVFPWFVLFAGSKVAGGTNIVIPGVDLSNLSTATFALVTAAMVGSLITSLSDFGISVPSALGRARGSGNPTGAGSTPTGP